MEKQLLGCMPYVLLSLSRNPSEIDNPTPLWIPNWPTSVYRHTIDWCTSENMIEQLLVYDR